MAENSSAGTAVGEPVTATDANGDELAYSFAAGSGEASFEIEGSTGRITVGSTANLDYESGDTESTVEVVASDGMLADTATVTITVTDADDPGRLRLDATVARVGARVTATLSDQDGSRNKRRRWQRSSDGGAAWTNISGATGRFYTPVASDEGTLLRAVFTYTDGHGPGRRAESAAVPVVGAATPVVSFGAETYSVAAGGSVDVTVVLSPSATETLAVDVTVGGSAEAETRRVKFGAGDSRRPRAVSAAGLAAGDTVAVTFGTLPAGVVADVPSEARVIVRETGADRRKKSRPAPLTVEYGEPSYTAQAGGAGAAVTVRLSPAADREVLVPVTFAGTGPGATASYLGVPGSVHFAHGDSVRTFTVEAPAEAPGGQVTLGFGELPGGVSAGALAASVVEPARTRTRRCSKNRWTWASRSWGARWPRARAGRSAAAWRLPCAAGVVRPESGRTARPA
ncbi:cadherin domain-containing protein [Candidatus Palauibacter sp.]|uniref:cadherin repeat domain-containing protein n=1 Tax=Candidatus Palauibacter sp. TaxID=3101350 RepID=UPI003B5A86AC